MQKRSSSGQTTSAARPIRILIVDDHPTLRMGLARLIDDEPDLTVCGDSESAAQAKDVIAATRPDVVIVDLSLGSGPSGLELVKYLTASHPDVRSLVFSMHDEVVYAERALRAGAQGYIMKGGTAREVLDAIRRVATGKLYVSERVSERLSQRDMHAGRRSPVASPFEHLTDRERQVFELIGSGHSTSQIAQSLKLSIKTIETHQAHIKDKLGLKSATELVRSAATWTHSL